MGEELGRKVHIQLVLQQPLLPSAVRSGRICAFGLCVWQMLPGQRACRHWRPGSSCLSGCAAPSIPWDVVGPRTCCLASSAANYSAWPRSSSRCRDTQTRHSTPRHGNGHRSQRNSRWAGAPVRRDRSQHRPGDLACPAHPDYCEWCQWNGHLRASARTELRPHWSTAWPDLGLLCVAPFCPFSAVDYAQPNRQCEHPDYDQSDVYSPHRPHPAAWPVPPIWDNQFLQCSVPTTSTKYPQNWQHRRPITRE